MQNEKNQLATAAEIVPPRQGQTPAPEARKRGLWNRLPAVVKIVLTLPVVMALLGAEIELRLAPQLDLVLTAAGICAMWAWLRGSSDRA
ncbi:MULTISPECIES: hypothetical protein [unclassified Acidocella]|uniref:hypothetical protein n=1 Tax=unclassified Acidocella TaxID=2648610 RepID=UPI00028DA66F|nr:MULTISPECIES: hypothetical protein [unclassified Acidocella]EKM99422.1 hypothetical protein MXAZACID_10543 [Acidocella sp. MX-AZ02]WBO58059.1 hypothetical protein GT370_12390 [Acidocella sp. MX-AZ03]